MSDGTVKSCLKEPSREKDKKKQRTDEESTFRESQRRTDGSVAINAPRIGTDHVEDNLNRDYAAVAQLMKDLDTQVECFSSNMNEMVGSIPAFDGLAAVWEGMARPSATIQRADNDTSDPTAPASINNRRIAAEHENVEELIFL